MHSYLSHLTPFSPLITIFASTSSGFTSFSDNEVSSATTTIGTMMSDNFTQLSNLFQSSPRVDSGKSEVSVPVPSHATIHSRPESCEGTVATHNQCLDSDIAIELPSTTAAISTMMSDNFTALSNFINIGPSLFSESSTKNGSELTPASTSSDSSDSNHSQLAESTDITHVHVDAAADRTDNDGSTLTSFSLSLPFMDAGKYLSLFFLSLLCLTNLSFCFITIINHLTMIPTILNTFA